MSRQLDVILHVAPEAAIGGPLALVRTGDRIRLSVKDRSIDLLVDEAELEKRRKNLKLADSHDGLRGYDRLYAQEVLQAYEGCDVAFLKSA